MDNEQDNLKKEFHSLPTKLSQQEIDRLVLEVRTSLENASLEETEKRVMELDAAFIQLQYEAKKTKQKHIVALEEYRNKEDRLSKSELDSIKRKKKIDSSLNDALKTVQDLMKAKPKSTQEVSND